MKNKLFALTIAALLLTSCDNAVTKTYTVTWKDYDGTVLELDSNVKEGTMPSYDGEEPTRASTETRTYYFTGWTPVVEEVTKDATYTATYQSATREYTIKFVDYDNTVLDTQTLEYGATPVYEETPYREEDDNYSYIFEGWDKEITTVTADCTYKATYSQHEKTQKLGVKTIAEVREICEGLTGANEAGIVIDMTRTVTIQGLALSKFSTVKSKKEYGLNLSYPNKTIFGDASGYIGCASGTDSGTLWGKVADYAGKEGSCYEITGYPSLYLGQPELYVPGKTYTYDSTLGITFDAVANSKGTKTIAEFYETASSIMYNCAGHAYGDVYTIEDLYVFEKRDDSYFATDGERTIKLKEIKSLSVGFSYDFTGYIAMNNYEPYMKVYSANNAANTPGFAFNSEKFEEKSITDLRKIKTSQDDTKNPYPDFIKGWGKLYKATIYANYYVVDGKYYVTVGDTFYKGKEVLQSRVTAQLQYGMADIANDNYWNTTWEKIARYCRLGQFINYEETCEFYYTTFQEEYSSGKPLWKLLAINSMLPPVPEIA